MNWFTGLVLLGFGGIVLLGNLTCLVVVSVRRTSTSLVPVIGGVCGFAGCALLPPLGWKVGLIPLALEPLGGVMLVCALVHAVKRALRWLKARRRL